MLCRPGGVKQGTEVEVTCRTELAIHIRAALRNGVTADELREVLLQTAVYAGVPAANAAFAVAQEVLGEQGGGGARP
jgi:4-carboxymuconolactone decarboxylase